MVILSCLTTYRNVVSSRSYERQLLSAVTEGDWLAIRKKVGLCLCVRRIAYKGVKLVSCSCFNTTLIIMSSVLSDMLNLQ